MRTEPHTPWTDEERAMLRRLRQNGVSLRQIGVMMGRTFHSVERQSRLLKLKRPVPVPQPKPEPPRRVRAGATLPPLPSLQC